MFLHFDIMSLIKVAPTTFFSAYIIWAFIAVKGTTRNCELTKKKQRQKEKKVLLVMSSVAVDELQLKLANCKQQQQRTDQRETWELEKGLNEIAFHLEWRGRRRRERVLFAFRMSLEQ